MKHSTVSAPVFARCVAALLRLLYSRNLIYSVCSKEVKAPLNIESTEIDDWFKILYVTLSHQVVLCVYMCVCETGCLSKAVVQTPDRPAYTSLKWRFNQLDLLMHIGVLWTKSPCVDFWTEHLKIHTDTLLIYKAQEDTFGGRKVLHRMNLFRCPQAKHLSCFHMKAVNSVRGAYQDKCGCLANRTLRCLGLCHSVPVRCIQSHPYHRDLAPWRSICGEPAPPWRSQLRQPEP